MPRYNEEINEEWISDKTRFIWDGLKSQRIDAPYIRKDGKLVKATWDEALNKVVELVKQTKPSKIGAIAGDMTTAEEMHLMKSLLGKLGTDLYDCRQDGSYITNKFGRASYIFNPSISGIEEADGLVIIGSNPRMESPVLNARIRKRWLTGNLQIFNIGQEHDLTYDYIHLGKSPKQINLKNMDVNNCNNIIWLIGDDVFTRDDSDDLLSHIVELAKKTNSIRDDWNGLAILHKSASRVAGLDLGFFPEDSKKNARYIADSKNVDLLFLMDADEINADNKYKVYIGSHGDKGATSADVILPGACYTEKNGFFMNTEGRLQQINRAVFPPGDAKDNWKIFIELSKRLKKSLNFIDFADVRRDLQKKFPIFEDVDVIQTTDFSQLSKIEIKNPKLNNIEFENSIKDFYLTNPIARASRIMAECSMQKKSNGNING
jgi:NADH-quinone oxidoreductase subunit G